MALLSGPILAARGVSVSAYWSQLSLPRQWLLMLYHMIAVHSLWWAPYWAYLLLISASARRAPVLWAFIPPFAIGVLERIAFNSSYFANILLYGLTGGRDRSVTPVAPGTMPTHPMTHITLGRFLGNPELWLALIIAG